mgnify:CR=1 FL=1
MSRPRPPLSLYLRSSAFWLVFFAGTLFFGVLIGALGWLLPARWSYALARAWCCLNLYSLRLFCGLDWRIEGRAAIPREPRVFFSKHQSTWETLALVVFLPPQVHVIKRELLRIPFYGWGHGALRPIAIDRSAGREAVGQLVAQGRERLDSGWSVMIFPEGTRVVPGETARYRMGGAVLAAESGVPVIPIAHNAGEFWPRHSFVKWPGTVTVVIGEEIQTAGKTPEAINAEARAWLEAMMARIEGAGPCAPQAPAD